MFTTQVRKQSCSYWRSKNVLHFIMYDVLNCLSEIRNTLGKKIRRWQNSIIYMVELRNKTLMQNSDPPTFFHFNCIFAYIGYFTHTITLNMINQDSQVYLCLTNIAFLVPNS